MKYMRIDETINRAILEVFSASLHDFYKRIQNINRPKKRLVDLVRLSRSFVG